MTAAVAPSQALPQVLPRDALLAGLAQPQVWDLAIVGGGATGLGLALDAAARGLRVVLLERGDFGCGTSSRSTKLVHGGVRYLAQGHWQLVRQALHERALLLANAPHLAQPLSFVMPAYRGWERPFYGTGLKLYDVLGGATLGASGWLDRDQVSALMPRVRRHNLRGGVQYWDGQFDDARLAVALARTAAQHGAWMVNHCSVTACVYDAARVAGVLCEDQETGRAFRLRARCVVNATGVWVDALRQQDGRAHGWTVEPLVAPSQGAHVVVDARFLSSAHALLVPRTADGRVLFALPWRGQLLLGTTDTPCADLPAQPRPLRQEIDFILQEAARYLDHPPQREDVRSCWAGLRPLVKPPHGASRRTSRLSREHTIEVGASGLFSVTGGKWTTYRAMAQEVLNLCARQGLLPTAGPSPTDRLPLVGAGVPAADISPLTAPFSVQAYGSEASQVQTLPGAGRQLAPGLSEAMVRFAARHEFARTVEDVLARRNRLMFLDAVQSMRVANEVGAILQDEGCTHPEVQAFEALAAACLPPPA